MRSGLGRATAGGRSAGIDRRYASVAVLLAGLGLTGCVNTGLLADLIEERPNTTIAFESIDGEPFHPGHVYVAPTPASGPAGSVASNERLRRILGDIPVTIGRSGLILVLTGTPGTASVIAQAIDESSLQEQEGTLAGDNTLLVLFADEPRLDRWLDRFRAIQAQSGGSRVP